jgi:hypothetical protein
MAENWTDLAPHPDPVEPGKKWHVFVSYRSTNRRWVLALYDILNGLGYKVFLDQYVLTAAEPLVRSLGAGLDSSESAILVWSGGYEDSEWCMQEFATLETKQNQKDGFRYVIAKIDDSEITGLAQTKLWVDFSQQREGPSGEGLLRLLYGLEGEPLSPGAVKMAAKVDDEMREGLLGIRACREIGDAAGLVALAETDNMAWAGSPMLMCAAAEGLIAMNKMPEAITVLDRADQAFPKAVRPKQLRGLALARSGQTMDAQLVLGKLHAAGEIGPETLGILARTWMDRYTETGQSMFLLKSRDLYRQAFEAFPTDYYTGINAASKSLLAGDKETAAQIAERVEDRGRHAGGERLLAYRHHRRSAAAPGQGGGRGEDLPGRRARRAARFEQPRLDAGPGRVAAVRARRNRRTEGTGHGRVSGGSQDLHVILQQRR